MTRDDQKGPEPGSDTWVDVADEAALRRHGCCLVQVAGQDVAMFAVGEEVFPVDDSCPHSGASLCTGLLHQREVQCRAHGLRFRLTDGLLSSAPANARPWAWPCGSGRCALQVDGCRSACNPHFAMSGP